MPASYQTLPDASYNGAFPPPPQQPTLTRKFAPYALLAGLAVTGFSLSYGAQPPPLLATATATSDAICTNGHYSKTTLKPAITYPFISLFPDTKGANKFEGSDVIYKDGMFYAIADSLWSILAVSSDLEVFSSANTMIGDPFRESDESGYEAIFNVDDMFYITRESVKNADGDGDYHAVIEEVTLDPEGGDYTIMNQCESSYVFEGDSKGFEGAVGLKDAGDGELYYLGLCEGNHCKEGGKGKEKGNGKLVVMRKTQDAEGCKWDETRTIDIPPTAHFQDYSAISVTDTGKVAVTSQEESALYVGHLAPWPFDAAKTEFVEGGKVYNFPRNSECKMIYCNIEGIHWIGEDQLVAVSDKMKNKGKQDFRCFDKDQSIHVFAMP